jgi:hypothetical protein
MPPSRVPSDDVEVLVGDVWYPGVLRGWQQRENGWWASVEWSRVPGETHLDVAPAARVRQVRYCPWWRGRRECLGWDDCEVLSTRG